MGFAFDHKSAGRGFARDGRLLSFINIFKTLAWLWVILTLIGMKPIVAEAAKKKTARKESPTGKPNPESLHKLTNTQAHNNLVREQEAPSAIDPLEKRDHVVYRTRPGDTIPNFLSRFRLQQKEKQLWLRSIQRTYPARTLPAGREIHFYFSKPLAPGRGQNAVVQLKAVEVDYSDAWSFTWEKGIRGILFQKRDKPYDVELKSASAVVENSLFEDGQKAGISSTLLSQLADIFTWDIDFEKDIRKGDSFKILYERRSRKGQETKTSLRILAAELLNTGQKLTAIYFERQKGMGSYYNLDGRSLARALLRFPLEFTSITSHVTDSRFHPILKVNMPHTGVDFAAQRGTPVRAVGDGVITQAGWNGAYGKLVEIQHDSVYTTRYAHLNGFAQGIRNGVTVKKGDVIGFVGSTGRSTGPHLHFELYKDQQYVDPLSVEFPAEDRIEPALQKLFDNQKQLFLVELSSPPQS